MLCYYLKFILFSFAFKFTTNPQGLDGNNSFFYFNKSPGTEDEEKGGLVVGVEVYREYLYTQCPPRCDKLCMQMTRSRARVHFTRRRRRRRLILLLLIRLPPLYTFIYTVYTLFSLFGCVYSFLYFFNPTIHTMMISSFAASAGSSSSLLLDEWVGGKDESDDEDQKGSVPGKHLCIYIYLYI